MTSKYTNQAAVVHSQTALAVPLGPALTTQQEQHVMLLELIPAAGHVTPHAARVDGHLGQHRGRVLLTYTGRGHLHAATARRQDGTAQHSGAVSKPS